jgi:hypothetical protein
MLQNRKKDQLAGWTKVAHGTASMTGKESPAKRFGSMVGNVDDAGDVTHDDDTTALPFLDGKVLNVDVSRVGSRFAFVDHRNSGNVVLVERCWTLLWDTKFMENCAKVFGDLGSMYSSDELGFSGTGSNCGLKLGLVRNGAASETEHNASEGAPCVSISGIGRIDEANKLQK